MELKITQLERGMVDACIPGTTFGGTFESAELAESAAEEFRDQCACHQMPIKPTHYYVRQEKKNVRTWARPWWEYTHIYSCGLCGFERPDWLLHGIEKAHPHVSPPHRDELIRVTGDG